MTDRYHFYGVGVTTFRPLQGAYSAGTLFSFTYNVYMKIIYYYVLDAFTKICYYGVRGE